MSYLNHAQSRLITLMHDIAFGDISTGPEDSTVHIGNQFVYCAAGFICAVIAAIYDLAVRRIPNYLTGAGLVVGLIIHFSLDGWRGALTSGSAALIAGVIFFIFFMAGGMGGGDVKLMAAVACLSGLQNLAYLLILTSLAGGVMAVLMALMHGSLKHTIGNVFSLANHHLHKGLAPHPNLNVDNNSTLRLPYGVAIAVGSFLTFYLQRVQN
ncbi:A24 family peptidase [Acidicapsa ligni]|uniref:A24 family peptidase n=1 Tax=Acidicapsa ligni TaxID=542300 RepID=UPI0021DFC906|nr:A24 family peptidase [Acidicapsa ligni]